MYFGTFLNIRGDSYQMHIIYMHIYTDGHHPIYSTLSMENTVTACSSWISTTTCMLQKSVQKLLRHIKKKKIEPLRWPGRQVN